MKKHKKGLDIHGCVYYNERACVRGELCVSTAMMQEIACKSGNFCGVCPVIGRLRQDSYVAYIAAMKLQRSAQSRPFFMEAE